MTEDKEKQTRDIQFEQTGDEEYTMVITDVVHLTPKEARAQLQKTEVEKEQLRKRMEQTKEHIENNSLQKELDEMSKEYRRVCTAYDRFREVLKNHEGELDKQLRTAVRKAKAKLGYKKSMDENQKIALSNSILAGICEDLDLDRADPVVVRVRQDFDKL